MNYEEELENDTEEIENSPESLDEQNEQLVQEEPASSSSIKKSPDLIKKILKHIPIKYKIIVIVVAAIIFLFLFILIANDFDFVGKQNKKVETYQTNCSQVYLTWEQDAYITKHQKAGDYVPMTNPAEVDLTDTERYSYKAYNYDQYVTSIIWNDNNAAGDVANEVVYEAMAIAARSRVVASLHENCVVLRDNNPENFTELSGNEPKYSEMSSAVSSTDGKIIGKNKQILDAKYDYFAYVKKSRENEAGTENIGVYYMRNVNEAGEQLLIPAEWVIENNIQTTKVDTTARLEYMSLYGARYLLEKIDKQYDLNRILEYYYGSDIEYYTIGGSSASVNCSQMDFFKTSLSKEEFVSLVRTHLSGKTSVMARLFYDKAEIVYDIGLEVGANPELAYIYAQKEQAWQDAGDLTLKCFNYYGREVSNGKKTGKCYSSFEDGVREVLTYFKGFGSLEALLGKNYSWIGTYLANPGSSGDGGCYYLTLPDMFGPNYSRCNSSYHCGSSEGGPGCVLTTEEERQAYRDWQIKKVLQIRENIFHLTADSCDVAGGVDGSTEGTTFLNESIATFLAKNGTSLEAYNNLIFDQTCKYQGTGKAVAYAAATAVSELAKYGKKFPYVYGGMHAGEPANYGVPSTWGTTGPDCSGFVSWALYNAGFTWKSLGATAWGNSGQVVDLNDPNVQVGDFIVTPSSGGYSHIVIITAVHREEGYYSVVEASSTKNGVIFNKVQMADSKGRKAVLMSNYYNTAAQDPKFGVMCGTR